MNNPDEVRALFEGFTFGPPCTEDLILLAEAALGETLPSTLRQLYFACDGFLGPTDAHFCWPLFGRAGLVQSNLFFRGDDLFPQSLVRQCIFFGDNGCGQQWGFMRDRPGRIIQWDAEWGDDFEVVGESLIEVWRAEKRSFDELASE